MPKPGQFRKLNVYIVVNYDIFIGVCLLQCNNYRVVNHCNIAIDIVSTWKDDGLSFNILFYFLIWSVVQNGSESCTLEKENHKHILGLDVSALSFNILFYFLIWSVVRAHSRRSTENIYKICMIRHGV